MPSEWREGEGKGERKTERQGAKGRERERESKRLNVEGLRVGQRQKIE